ncbi:type I-D CRISPR-associated helicase Cas3' [Microcoleus sp. bin38.metabat.b11b12b14.051]|uniref:type I-D CRISPR-associated helicase Cas3' n=1 Tax=Microcoleus sp. bin38.metabat.b11b12b14.051 TaxID=2742709 RepID=UPI0025EF9AD2|nr:type I-D CRISPR-associated helicase Cas3' [Microcoleus sp. bin38.metabat.b11b12b14.051]
MDNLKIQLEPACISACRQLPSQLEFMEQALQHQVDIYAASEDNDIVIDTAPTGTGKTQAGLNVLLHNPQRNAIYIAPTNALIDQQTKTAQEFVRKANLPHLVKAASAKEVNLWPDDRVGKRSGEKIYNVLREPATIFPECGGGRPLLLVTNPDIFYYATFFAYNKLDRDNIASEFYSSFSTVIFDEFHLYNAKQLVSLFFYLALSKEFGYFQHNRKIVLLTATPEPACEEALNVLGKNGVRIYRTDSKNQIKNLLPSQTQVNLEIRKQPEKDQLITEIVAEVVRRLREFPDENGAVILDGKDTLGRISDRLRDRGFADFCGRITGDTPKEERPQAAQKQVILATSTVDVGFNFERDNPPPRQNLDWLIFSTRDRFAFWQRIGRVGRVLGKTQTDIASGAIAYLPDRAWEEGIAQLDCNGGRNSLTEMLASLDCMKRPFLEIYWRSEAFLEIAKPLLELEILLEKLPEASLVSQLYQTLQIVLGGKRDWSSYRQRMKVLQGAENVAKSTIKQIQKEWKYIKGGQNCVISFMQANYPEDWEEIRSGRSAIESIEEKICKHQKVAEEFKEYATILKTSYAPLFKFRESLFENIKIYDPHNFLLDEVGETNLDPIHLLRYFEFDSDERGIVLTDRATETYGLKFALQVPDLEEFANNYLCKLYAFKNCTIERTIDNCVRPTALISQLSPPLMPGVIVKEHRKNSWAILKLRKQGVECYSITVTDIFGAEKEYKFFPSLSGILAIASAGIALKCPDNQEFWVI